MWMWNYVVHFQDVGVFSRFEAKIKTLFQMEKQGLYAFFYLSELFSLNWFGAFKLDLCVALLCLHQPAERALIIFFAQLQL